MEDTLLRLLRVFDRTTDATLLEQTYRRVDRRTYELRNDVTAADEAKIAGILMSPDTGWWASAFSTGAVNATLESMRQAANVPVPSSGSTLRDLLVDRNDFPSRVRIVGSTAIPVTRWNALVLLGMITACHGLSILHLRYRT
jgi:hypothetical protein